MFLAHVITAAVGLPPNPLLHKMQDDIESSAWENFRGSWLQKRASGCVYTGDARSRPLRCRWDNSGADLRTVYHGVGGRNAGDYEGVRGRQGHGAAKDSSPSLHSVRNLILPPWPWPAAVHGPNVLVRLYLFNEQSYDSQEDGLLVHPTTVSRKGEGTAILKRFICKRRKGIPARDLVTTDQRISRRIFGPRQQVMARIDRAQTFISNENKKIPGAEEKKLKIARSKAGFKRLRNGYFTFWHCSLFGNSLVNP